MIVGGLITNYLGKWVERNYDAFVLNESEMAVRKISMNDEDFTWGRAVMIVPGKVMWICEGNDDLHLYDSATETIETIHEF